MPSSEMLLAFSAVSVGIMVVPGPSNLFLLAHAIGHGRRAALAATIGISIASAIRVIVVASGLSAVIASSPVAFDIIRWAGVGYLVYLGIGALRAAHPALVRAGEAGSVPTRRSIRQGLIVGLSNPKVIIFYLAFFPQFIDAARGSVLVQTLVLGGVFWIIGTVWDLGFAYASGSIGGWMQSRSRVRTVQHGIEGVSYGALAVWAALASLP